MSQDTTNSQASTAESKTYRVGKLNDREGTPIHCVLSDTPDYFYIDWDNKVLRAVCSCISCNEQSMLSKSLVPHWVTTKSDRLVFFRTDFINLYNRKFISKDE